MSSKIIIKYDNFKAIAAKMPKQVNVLVRRTAFDVKAQAINLMKGAKSGRQYRRGKKIHIASRPGEAPAVDTGNLKNSIFVEMTSETSAVVGVGAEYGLALEFGTRRMAERPFMRPSAEKAAQRYFAAMRMLEEKIKP